MKSILRNILAVVIGIVLGSIVNMSIIMLGPYMIAPPAGVDVSNVESIAASIHLYGPIDFLIPFLAHALGTLVGAGAAFVIAVRHRTLFAYVIGAFFLVGGISVSFMIHAPAWFKILDIVVAYIPMAWLGTLIGRRIIGSQNVEQAQ